MKRGLCDHVLGNSTVQFMIAGGCKWATTIDQDTFQANHTVPAQLLETKIIEIRDNNSGVTINH